MAILIVICAVVFVLSMTAIQYAWRMSPVAESGQIGSIIMLGGLVGSVVSLGLLIFLCGMLFAGAQL